MARSKGNYTLIAKPAPWRVMVTPITLIVAAALLVAFPAASTSSPPAEQSAAAEIKVFADHDAKVIKNKPNANRGSSKTLAAQFDPKRKSFIKFTVPAGTGEVAKATLKIRVKSRVDTRIKVRKAAKGWNEATVTYANAPDLKRSFGEYNVAAGKPRWIEVDVSSYVDGPGKYSFGVVGRDGKKAVFKSSESSRPPRLLLETGSAPPPPPPPPPVDQPEPPIRAAFMYPWFPNAWDQGGQYPYTQFTPSLGLYDSSDPDLIDEQVTLATGAGMDAFIASWWGPGHHTDDATMAVVNRIPSSPNPNFRIAVYYEEEGQSNPSATAIKNDLEYLERFFDKPSYLRIDGKPVVFVWSTGGDGANMATRWKNAKDLYGGDVHVVLKVFSGYKNVADQPDSWHQYGPANNYSEHLPDSAVVSPGFWHADESSPRLGRNPSRFRNDVQAMVASGAFWQLVTAWNEWGEGTSVEPADEFGTTYLDILADELNGAGVPPPPPPPPTTTTTQAPPPPPPPPGNAVTFAAGGDFGATSKTDATFAAIGASDSEFLLALGDLAYGDATEGEWCNYVKGYLGSTFPVQLVVGNHEDDDREDGYIGNFASCLPDRMGSTGTYTAEYYFDVDGIARFIMIGAGNDVGGEKYDYEVGNAHYQWLSSTIDDARNDGIPWVIVGMHKVCITAGNKPCEVGAELYDLLLDKRVDVILHGHDHDYQRSKQLTCATPEDYRSSCVADSGADGRYSKGAGSVFVVIGNTGGGAHTDIDTGDPDIGYLAKWLGGNSSNAGRGFVQFTVDANQLHMEFIGSTTTWTDSFVID